MLAEVAAQIPDRCKVILLAVRGFGHIQLMETVKTLGWYFRIRLKSDTWVHFAGRKRLLIVQKSSAPS
jgi:hypothetical protein